MRENNYKNNNKGKNYGKKEGGRPARNENYNSGNKKQYYKEPKKRRGLPFFLILTLIVISL